MSAASSFKTQLSSLHFLQDQTDFQALAQWLRSKLLGLDLSEYETQLRGIFNHFESEDQTKLQGAVDALQYLILYLAKLKGTTEDLEAVLSESELPQKLIPILKTAFNTSVLYKLRGDLLVKKEVPQFADMKWRLELQLGSRNLKETFIPKMMIQLDVKESKLNEKTNQGGLRSFVFETDYANLKRMQEELKQALNSLSDPYSRKIYKFVK